MLPPVVGKGRKQKGREEEVPAWKEVKSGYSWDFSGGPVAKTVSSQYREHGFDPWGRN